MESSQSILPKPSIKLTFTITNISSDEKSSCESHIKEYTLKHSNPDYNPNFSSTNLNFDQRKNIINYPSFIKYITDIFSSPSLFPSELSYRLYTKFPLLLTANLSLEYLYTTIGKIGSNRTHLDPSAYEGKSIFYNQLRKFYGINTDLFPTTRTNNCVTSGKWSYEVVLLSNGLFQLGYSQLLTPNTEINGVGDDLTSYAYDGYRKVAWNQNSVPYGKIWDTGDVIGVCIDLTQGNEHLEYFLNGISLGTVFNNNGDGQGISKGKNMAYFPAVSCSHNERLQFNFGEVPFYYNYNTYETFDLQSSIYDSTLLATSKLINAFNNDLLYVIALKNKHCIRNNCLEFKMTSTQKLFINKMVIGYLINVSFEDLFISKDLLYPYLSNLLKTDKIQFNIFFDQIEFYFEYHCNDNNKQRHKFYYKLFKKISNLIEEYACIGNTKINQWSNTMDLLIKLCTIDHILLLWLNWTKLPFHLSLIFNSNTCHINSIYDQILKENDEHKYSRSKQLKSLIKTKDFKVGSYENEIRFSEGISEFLLTFIMMCQKNNVLNECIQVFNTVLETQYKMEEFSYENYDKFEFSKSAAKNNCKAIKNFIINLMKMYLDNYSNILIENIKNDPVISILLNMIIKFSGNITDYIRNLMKYYKHYKALPDRGWQIDPNFNTDILSILYKQFFDVFNDYHQSILYQFSLYLINYFSYNMHHSQDIDVKTKIVFDFTNKEIIFPALVMKFLDKFHSKLLKNDKDSLSFKAEIMKKCNIFNKRDYAASNLYFLLEVLNHNSYDIVDLDQHCYNLKLIIYFAEKKKYSMMIINDNKLSELLIKVISINIPNYDAIHLTLCSVISRIFTFDNIPRMNTTYITTVLNGLSSIETSDLTKYCLDYADQKITKYLSNFDQIKEEGYKEYNYIYIIWFKRSYKKLCYALNLYRFAIQINETIWLNSTDSIISIQFKTLMVNITSRIITSAMLEEITKLKGIYEKFNGEDKEFAMSFIMIRNAIVNLFGLILSKEKEVIKMVERLGENDAINIENIKQLNQLCAKENDIQKEKEIEVFCEMIDKIHIKQKDYLKDRKSWNGLYEDNACILCFEKKVNKMLLPCNHKACNECLIIYMINKNICFICREEIDEIVDCII